MTLSIPRVRAGLYAASSVLSLFFLFVSFHLHFGKKRDRTLPRVPFTSLRVIGAALTAGCYIAEVVLTVSQDEDKKDKQDHIAAIGFLAFAWLTACFGHQRFISRIVGLAFISFVLGLPILILTTLESRTYENLFVLGVTRLSLFVLLFIICLPRFLHNKTSCDQGDDAETTPFLDDEDLSGPTPYGTESIRSKNTSASSSDSDSDSDSDDDDDDKERKDSHTTKLRKSGSWSAYLDSFKIFIPFIIPRHDLKVQACILVCILCLVATRVLNILVPQQLANITDKLFAGQLPYTDLLVYFALNFIEGSSGVDMVQALAQIPIEQFSYRQLTNAAFSHVMSQSMDFHEDRDSAEVMKAIEQGEALTNVVKTAITEIVPPVADMTVAVVLIYFKFDSVVMLSMVVCFLVFLTVEVVSFTWNVENRRQVTKSEREEARVQHQAVQGWQTVSAFNMFSYEKFRFGNAVNKHLGAKKSWLVRDAYIDALMQAMVPCTFFILASLVIHEVYEGRAKPGDFVFLTQYWDYLIWPIKYLSHEYRYLMSDLIDAERLLDLLTTKSTIVDKEDAIELSNVQGRVDFKDVRFTYDTQRTAIHDVNITAQPGETVALVGATGAGKSSLTKLLMRLYDVTSGSIQVDGHDVRDVTQGSLRDVLGVVPQDPLLFNASILENLRYAKLSATDDEIHQACRAAAIHDKILTFTHGYDTQVGEKGVKLSGGEVQRLAIARVFLKDPPILILDEATSAVDTETESLIQEALRTLSTRRTTFVIAHRMSTIVGADQILVMHDGTVMERGTHQELMAKQGRYYYLWQKQFESLPDDSKV